MSNRTSNDFRHFQTMMRKGISHPRAINTLLHARGTTQTAIAKKLGVSRQYVSLVVCGHARAEVIELAISDVLGFDPWARV